MCLDETVPVSCFVMFVWILGFEDENDETESLSFDVEVFVHV